MTCTATETAGPTFLLITETLWRHISLSQILAPKDFGSKIRELVRGNLNILKNFPFYASFEAQPPPAVTSGLSAFLRLNSLGVASCLQNRMGRMKLCSSQTKRVGFQMLQESNSTGLSRHTYMWTGQAGRLVSRHHHQQQPLPRSHTPTFLGWSVAT